MTVPISPEDLRAAVAAIPVLPIAGGIPIVALPGNSISATAIAGLVLCWLGAESFTRMRRMVLPSIVLAAGTALFAMLAAFWLSVLWGAQAAVPPPAHPAAPGVPAALVSGCGALAAFALHLRFKLPFALFVSALLLLPTALLLTGAGDGLVGLWLVWADRARVFDLSGSPPIALATLGFGLAAFAVAMAFDLADPHRVRRFSRSRGLDAPPRRAGHRERPGADALAGRHTGGGDGGDRAHGPRRVGDRPAVLPSLGGGLSRSRPRACLRGGPLRDRPARGARPPRHGDHPPRRGLDRGAGPADARPSGVPGQGLSAFYSRQTSETP